MKNSLTIVGVALLAAVAGFSFYRLSADAPTSSVAPVAIAEAAPQARKPVTTLPEFSLQNRAGQKQSVRSWPDKALIVNFWATWCGPCRKEIPLLKEIAKTEEKSGFQVVGIAIDFRDDVLKYADEIKMDYPLLIGEQDGLAAADAFGVESAGLPFTVFTDNKGRIVNILMGELTREKSKVILGAVKKVNKGELTPEKARVEIQAALMKI